LALRDTLEFLTAKISVKSAFISVLFFGCFQQGSKLVEAGDHDAAPAQGLEDSELFLRPISVHQRAAWFSNGTLIPA
jgi:hypothetical protein